MTADPAQLVLCSKSTWYPAIRREHALTGLASANGHPVEFLERSIDIRAFRSAAGARRWGRALAGRERIAIGPRVTVTPTATVVPGHRSYAAERSHSALVRRRARGAIRPGATVVVTTPWLWAAARAIPDVRLVFECDDDWATLIPSRAQAFHRTYEKVAREADAIIAVNPAAQALFGGRPVTVIRNGVDPALIAAPRMVERKPRRLLYVGTLSPRFDADLVRGLLRSLPDWELDIYGQCQYPGAGLEPDRELRQLLDDHRGQLTWHGVVPRERLAEVIDGATVGLVPNRRDPSGGQDSMKLYDYSARGLPVVSTRWSDNLAEDGPPGLELADTVAEMAAAVRRIAVTDAEATAARLGWAESNSWPRRWPAWSRVLFPDGDPAAVS
ncbi:MAG TPA: glycosyltransferase [Solirubrobacteraceae bacterium]|nr:glycosyltransferase [Solirubrobacteraceae bacterium]